MIQEDQSRVGVVKPLLDLWKIWLRNIQKYWHTINWAYKSLFHLWSNFEDFEFALVRLFAGTHLCGIIWLLATGSTGKFHHLNKSTFYYIHTEIYTLKSRKVNFRTQTDVNQSNVAYLFSHMWEKQYVQSGAAYHVRQVEVFIQGWLARFRPYTAQAIALRVWREQIVLTRISSIVNIESSCLDESHEWKVFRYPWFFSRRIRQKSWSKFWILFQLLRFLRSCFLSVLEARVSSMFSNRRAKGFQTGKTIWTL